MPRVGVLFLIVVLCAFSGLADTNVWFVKTGGASGDGRSWNTAFDAIQPAIDAAFFAGGGEVWVAAGTYGEVRNHIKDNINTGSLALRPGVALYGGFHGTESTRDARDADQNITVISGKTARDGKAAYHVVIGADKSTLDGFIIRDGLANAEHPIHKRGGHSVHGHSSDTDQLRSRGVRRRPQWRGHIRGG